MPKVPIYDGGTVQEQGPQEGRVPKLQAQDFGPSPVAAGLEGGAASLEKYAAVHQEIVNNIDEANAKNAFSQYVRRSDEVLHTGQNPYFALSGKSAVDARGAAETELQQTRDQILGATRTPRERQMLDNALGARVEEDLKGIGSHAAKESFTFNVDESASRAELLSSDAARNAYNPDIVEANVTTGKAEIEHLGGLQGWGREQITDKQLHWTSGVRKEIATRYVYDGPQGPDVAQKYAEAHAGELTAKDAQTIDDHIRTQRSAVAAEQRRQEAEQRRLEKEAQREAGDRAADVDRLVTQGIPVPAPVLANALADARAAKRPGLESSLRIGGFKNDLTVQYRGATPEELQNRLNVLGPKIKEAGDHPNPNDVIEFQHIQTLHDKSASELASDPLSWAAGHQGEKVPPINWSDPGSIAQRVQVASRVSARTGAPIRPLTADEATALAPKVATGSIAERRDLIARMAAFGPAALPAAQQIAPSDHAFQGLVGLATSNNRAASSTYIAQALAGTEVLKRNPKAVDTNLAQVRYNNYVGKALSLMPNVSEGVFTNARNIVAAWADQHGHTDWKHDTAIQDQMEGSVDAALGAYNQGGVKYGGLGMWKGDRIVLPDGMSQQQFEERVSRANEASLTRGSNGVPVWGDGHPLKVGEVKGLHMVAVGNGVYRLTNGSNFVAKKGGGFYELDVKRVR